MNLTDPIADMFTRIRNSLMVGKESTVIPFSKEKLSIAHILKDKGFLNGVAVEELKKNRKNIKVKLAYDGEGRPLISEIKRVSTPGKRIYVKKCEVPKVMNGFGISIVSTSIGILDGRSARVNNTGGELLGIVH